MGEGGQRGIQGFSPPPSLPNRFSCALPAPFTWGVCATNTCTCSELGSLSP